MKKYFELVNVLLVFAAIFSMSCSKKTTDATDDGNGADASSYLAESASSDAASEANSISTTGLLMAEDLYDQSQLQMQSQSQSQLQSQEPSQIQPLATCSISAARSACSSTVTVVDWAACTLALPTGNVTIDGTITESYSGFGAAVCQMNGSNSVVTRVIDSSNPRTVTFPSGAVLTSDMDPGTAWDGTTFANASSGTKVSRLEVDTNGLTCNVSSPCYRIEVRGLQNTLVGPAGRTVFDHIVTSDLLAKGTKSTGTLNMNGTATTYHQTLLYTAAHTFTNVSWTTSSCCFPTSGTISTVLTGALTGTMSLAFSDTCGTATLTGTDGASATVALSQCKY